MKLLISVNLEKILLSVILISFYICDTFNLSESITENHF